MTADSITTMDEPTDGTDAGDDMTISDQGQPHVLASALTRVFDILNPTSDPRRARAHREGASRRDRRSEQNERQHSAVATLDPSRFFAML